MSAITVAAPQARKLYSNLLVPHLFAVLVGTLLSVSLEREQLADGKEG